MISLPEIRVFRTSKELFQAAAQGLRHIAINSAEANGWFNVALSGGSTPKMVYSLLSGPSNIPWERVRFFWSDERHVPPDHPDSNYRMAYETLLSKIPAKPENIFRVPSENPDANAAAAAYEQTIRAVFGIPASQVPQFDLILLGLGADGHTASLFPGSKALDERVRLVVANWVEKLQSYRITLTLPVLNHAARLVFLVAGGDKAAALAAVFDSRSPGEQFPAKLVRPANGQVLWLADQPAAGSLPALPSAPVKR
jgi:6-phosphogluconolactonase